MHQLIDKKKYLLYLSIFFLLSTINSQSLINLKLFKIKDIEVLEDKSNINNSVKEIIEDNLTIFKNQNIFLLDKNQIVKKISDNNWISNFSIQKKYPSKLIVNLKKTEPIAKIIVDNEIFYVGSNFKLIKSKIQFNDLPNIFGKPKINEFKKLITNLNLSSLSYKDISDIYYLKSGRWNLKIQDDVIIKLPRDNILESLNLVKKILDNKNIISKNTIDLTIKNQIIVD
jgi:cell division protein FtsQ|tara:strand:- start:407 stop:1090 length:684 start_codon:yes stop_codon:yes gene_type:complete